MFMGVDIWVTEVVSKPDGRRCFQAEVYSFFLSVLWPAFEPAPVMPDSVSGSIVESRVLLLRHLFGLPGAAVGLPQCAVGPCLG